MVTFIEYLRKISTRPTEPAACDYAKDFALDTLSDNNHPRYTQQLKDYTAIARANNLRFDLFVKKGATFTKPLQQAIDDGIINHIPF